MRDREVEDMGGRGGVEELRGIEGRETNQGTLCEGEKSILIEGEKRKKVV